MTLNKYDKIKQLYDASEIYASQYVKMQQEPRNMANEVLSRLSSRSQLTSSFASSSGLEILQSYINDKEYKPIFTIENESLINNFMLEDDGPLIFIECISDSMSTLYIVNSITTKLIGSIQFRMVLQHIKIILNKEQRDFVNTISVLNGYIYFVSMKTLYVSKFNGVHKKVKEFDDDIIEIIILKKDCLIILSLNKIVLLNPNETDNQQIISLSNQIETFESTIPNEKVYKLDYLTSVDSVVFILGLKNRNIEIYLFDVKYNKLNMIRKIESMIYSNYSIQSDNTSFEENECQQSLIIDRSFYINNLGMNENRVSIIRFAVELNGKITIMEINNEADHTVIDEINMEMFEKVKEKDENYDKLYRTEVKNEIELESFSENKLIVNYIQNYKSTKNGSFYTDEDTFIYDLEKKMFIYNNNHDRFSYALFFYEDQNVFIQISSSSYNQCLSLFMFNENKLEQIYSLDSTNYNYIRSKSAFKFKDGKLLAIAKEFRVSSIIEYDYENYESDFIKESAFGINEIYCTVCSSYILVSQYVNESREMELIDVTTQEILKSFDFEKTEFLASSNNYFILLNKNDEDECWDFFIFTIKENQVESRQLDIKYTEDLKVDFMGLNETNFVFVMHNTDGLTRINFFEIEPEFESCQLRKLVELKHELKNDEILQSTYVTHKNNYLILWIGKKASSDIRLETIYYVDLKDEMFMSNNILDSIELMQYWDNYIDCLPNCDNLIVTSRSAIVYIHLNRHKHIQEYKLKEFKNEMKQVKVDKNYLFILNNENIMEIYKLDSLNETKQLKNKTIISLNDGIDEFCISNYDKYLIILTKNREIYVYKLTNMQQIGFLKLYERFYGLKSSEQYINIHCYNDQLLSCKIIEQKI